MPQKDSAEKVCPGHFKPTKTSALRLTRVWQLNVGPPGGLSVRLSRTIISLANVSVLTYHLHRTPVFYEVIGFFFAQTLHHARIEFRSYLLVFISHFPSIPIGAIRQLDFRESYIPK